MKRKAMNGLIQWKETKNSPLFLIEGVKGVGKTYLAIDFAKNYYSEYFYLNFEYKPEAVSFFTEKLLAGETIESVLVEYFQIPEVFLYHSLFVFDEISFCPVFVRFLLQCAKTKLKCLLLSSFSTQETKAIFSNFFYSFLRPLDFEEFLMSVGSDWYIKMVQAHFQNQKPIPDIVHQELLALLEEYLIVGGMPSVINEYIQLGSTINLQETQQLQLLHIESALAHLYAENDANKMFQILKVIPEQFIKENHKFQWNLIRKGVTYSLYEDCLNLLTEHGVVLRLNNENQNKTSFKLYSADVGILYSILPKVEQHRKMSRKLKNANQIQSQSQMAAEEGMPFATKQILLEQYIMQELSAKKHHICFWESTSKAKLEFLLHIKEGSVPIEVQVGEHKRLRSLSVYTNTNEYAYALRISFKNFYVTDNIKNIPYYAVFCL